MISQSEKRPARKRLRDNDVSLEPDTKATSSSCSNLRDATSEIRPTAQNELFVSCVGLWSSSRGTQLEHVSALAETMNRYSNSPSQIADHVTPYSRVLVSQNLLEPPRSSAPESSSACDRMSTCSPYLWTHIESSKFCMDSMFVNYHHHDRHRHHFMSSGSHDSDEYSSTHDSVATGDVVIKRRFVNTVFMLPLTCVCGLEQHFCHQRLTFLK